MAANIKQLFRMYALYGRMDWHFMMRDKRMGLITLICEWISTLASFSGLALLAVRFDGIGGLTADEILWLLGFFLLGDGFGWMMLGGFNVMHISRRIGRGQVDHMLIQPCPLWMQMLTEGFMPFSGSSSFWAGLILTVAASIRLRITVTPGWLCLLIMYMIARTAINMGVSFLAGSAAFYHPVSCEELSSVALDALHEAGKYPLMTLPPALQALFLTALPVGLLAYLPSMILLNKISAPAALAWPVAAAAAFVSLAAVIFRKGLKHYASHGCPRYKEMGHRC